MLYPKVRPDPSMYCPSVLVTPLGPAPNLIMENPPIHLSQRSVLVVKPRAEAYRI